jgi:hypothetical protein
MIQAASAGTWLAERSSAQSAGVTVNATTSEASTAETNASASGAMNWPCTPEMKYTGTNSATTASVANSTGERISSDASRTTVSRGAPLFSRRRRMMFSMSMIASSTSTPIATAKPPIVIAFNV